MDELCTSEMRLRAPLLWRSSKVTPSRNRCRCGALACERFFAWFSMRRVWRTGTTKERISQSYRRRKRNRLMSEVLVGLSLDQGFLPAVNAFA